MEAMKNLERLLKGLANKRRLAIIKLLLQEKELPVAEIADGIGLSFWSTSKHLNLLANLDVLAKEQRSLQMFYRLSSPPHPIVKLVAALFSN